MTNNPASITQDEARAALDEIDRTAARIRKSLATAASPLLILWGVIWIIGYGSIQFFPQMTGRIFLVLDLLGVALSLVVGPWFGRSALKSPNHGRIGLAWVALLAYGMLWMVFLGHRAGLAGISAFWATVCMLGYVIMGLWLDRYILWLGLFVTVATVVGYFILSHWFFLWLAVTGGGSLVATGVFIRKYWR